MHGETVKFHPVWTGATSVEGLWFMPLHKRIKPLLCLEWIAGSVEFEMPNIRTITWW